MDSIANQLAPINFDEGYMLGQQPHEMGLRSSTYIEFSKWLNVRLDLQGAELIDPTPAGTAESPAVIPAGPEDKKGKFEPEPGFYQGFPEVISGKRFYFYWDKTQWTLWDLGDLPKNEGTESIEQELIPKGKAVTKYAPSKSSLGITEFADNQEIAPELKLAKVSDDNEFVDGFLRKAGTVGTSSAWKASKNFKPILPGDYKSNLALTGNAFMLIYDSGFNIIQDFSSKGAENGTSEWTFTAAIEAAYYKTSRSNGPTSQVDYYIKSVGDKKKVEDTTFVTPTGLDKKLHDKGFIQVPIGTNMLTELTESTITDETLWADGYLHYNGTIVPGTGWKHSVKKYRVYPGKFQLKCYFGGNSRIWVLDKDGSMIRDIENTTGSYNYSAEEVFTASEYYIQVSYAVGGTGTDYIKCESLENISYFDGGVGAVNVIDAINNTDTKNAVNSLGIANGILGSLKSSVKLKDKFPVVTFVADDLGQDDLEWYKGILDAKNVKGSFAAIKNRVIDDALITTERPLERFETLVSQVKMLIAENHDIISHTVSHQHTGTLPVAQQVLELRDSKLFLMQKFGIDCNIIAPPFGSQPVVTERIVRQYYNLSIISNADSLVAAGTCCNEPPIDSYQTKRVSFDAVSTDQSLRLQLCKNAVDVALSKSQWLIFAVHPQFNEYSEEHNAVGYARRRHDLADLIDYIKALDIPIMTAKNALELWRNPVELGNKRLEPNFYTIGMNGATEGSYF